MLPQDADRGARISPNRRFEGWRISFQKVENRPGGSSDMLNDKLCKRKGLSKFLDGVSRNYIGVFPRL